MIQSPVHLFKEADWMERNRFLDVMKGIAILFVITTHYQFSNQQRNQYLFFYWIGMAVPIFMIITGYVYAKSFQKKGMETFEQTYSTKNLVPRLLRFAIPYAMFFIIEVLLKYKYEKKVGTLKFLWKFGMKIFRGGDGYGSYYIPVMFQFVFLFPMIYFIVKKKGMWGVILCGIINAVYEFTSNVWGLGKPAYRLLVFRFILVIAYGCYVALYEDIQTKKIWKILCFVVGTLYIYNLMEKIYPLETFLYWKHVNMISCLYIIPIMGFLIRKCHLGFKPLEIIGRATFDIFLTQKLYYHYFADRFVYVYIDDFYLRVYANIIICCIVGVIIYYIETPISNRIIKWCKGKLENKDSEKGIERINRIFCK